MIYSDVTRHKMSDHEPEKAWLGAKVWMAKTQNVDAKRLAVRSSALG
jgi:hypothetical protein